MNRRRIAIVLALGLAAPFALTAHAAGALEQDLVATPTSGPVGTTITLTSATCVGTGDDEVGMEAALYVGTAPDQQIAASTFGEGSVELTVPDWVDPDQPAVIEASCFTFDPETGDDDSIDYDPIPFDVEPGGGTPVQVRSFSRTELLAGQGLGITGSCGPAFPNGFVQAFLASGTDQTAQDYSTIAGYDFGLTEADGSFEMSLIASNAAVYLNASFDENDDLVDISTEEMPLDVPPGDYTLYVACAGESQSVQYLQPGTVTITGAAPTDGIDLTVDGNTRNITLAGTCDQGDVTGGFEATSLQEFVGQFDAAPDARPGQEGLLAEVPRKANGVLAGHPLPASAVRGPGGSLRALVDDGYSEFATQPGADGAWSAGDTVGFDQGLAVGIAYCGDPLGDGYFYDPQGVEVDVEDTTTTTVTVPPTTPPAPPANAVAGRPTYAG